MQKHSEVALRIRQARGAQRAAGALGPSGGLGRFCCMGAKALKTYFLDKLQSVALQQP